MQERREIQGQKVAWVPQYKHLCVDLRDSMPHLERYEAALKGKASSKSFLTYCTMWVIDMTSLIV